MIEYYTIATIAILAAMSPGPDFVVVVKNAISHGRKMGTACALGIGTGVLFHVTYCVLGLALVISQSILLFNVIKVLGASYLIYLGLKGIFSKSGHAVPKAKHANKPITAWRAYREGFFVNMFNPKCTLFMLSVFTLVVEPHTPMLTQISYGVEIAFITGLWFFILAWAVSLQRFRAHLAQFEHIVSKVLGTVLVALGGALIVESLYEIYENHI